MVNFNFNEIPTKGLININIGIYTKFVFNLDKCDSSEIEKFAATYNIYDVSVNFEKNDVTLKVPTKFFI